MIYKNESFRQMTDSFGRPIPNHFDRERIPERVVHAKGAGAYGVFQCSQGLGEYTMAEFLSAPNSNLRDLERFWDFISLTPEATQLMAGGGVALIGTTLVPLLSGLFLNVFMLKNK